MSEEGRMATKISKKIVGYKVVNAEEEKAQAEQAQAATEQEAKEQAMANVVHMHESVDRPEMLLGSTYKIKTPLSEHALYITINDIVLNPGTEHEMRRPFEMFINSKNMDQFQWVVALTRVVSAVFRKGGDVTFLAEELKAVFDPQGGYFKRGGRFMPSLVAEIGEAIESHMRMIGLIKNDGLDDTQKKFVEAKRAEYDNAQKPTAGAADAAEGDAAFPAAAIMCNKCSTKAVIRMDGCNTCLNCGDSKCG
jgi:hypothetical protein